MEIRIQIAEQNKYTWELIKDKINRSTDKKVHFAPFRPSAELVLKDLLSKLPNILIIDVEAFETLAFNLSNYVINRENKPQIILIVSCDRMADIQPIMEIGICALLVKPLAPEKLQNAIDRSIALCEREPIALKPAHTITLRSNYAELRLSELDILSLESRHNGCKLTLKNGEHKILEENIFSIEKCLNSPDLIRIDEDTIININKISYLSNHEHYCECRLRLSNGEEIVKFLSKVAQSRLQKIYPICSNSGPNKILSNEFMM
ncbi:MAG TPA: LytTR family transcriptional regulator DNA-binding domain-containing protein [Niabella sp.]|nr:LytTR family transcriptional regulator DNA-binding domain-containing protein [Niabella sp.]